MEFEAEELVFVAFEVLAVEDALVVELVVAVPFGLVELGVVVPFDVLGLGLGAVVLDDVVFDVTVVVTLDVPLEL